MKFKIIKKIKALTTVLISTMLAFPPQIFAAEAIAKSRIDTMEKALIESGLTKGEVTVAEYYKKNYKNIPEFVRSWVREGLAEDPDALMPQVSVRRIKVKDKEELQVSYASEGESAVINFVDDGFNFMKMGNQTISVLDFLQGPAAVHKIEKALPNSQAASGWRKHYNKEMFPTPVLLKYEDLQKLSKVELKKYLENYREILALTEKLQNTSESGRTAQNWFFEVMVPRLNAQAALPPFGTPCIIAGRTSYTGVKTSTKKNSCGIAPNGKPFPDLQGPCASDEVQCNQLLYGEKSCVKLASDATDQCNKKFNVIEGYLYKTQGQTLNKGEAQKVKDEYNASLVELEAKLKGDGPGKCPSDLPAYNRENKTSSEKILSADQKRTCEELFLRIADARKMSCTPPEGGMTTGIKKAESFKDNPRLAVLCEEPVPPIAPPPAPAPPAPPAPPGGSCPGPGVDVAPTPGGPTRTACLPAEKDPCLVALGEAKANGVVPVLDAPTLAAFKERYPSSDYSEYQQNYASEKNCSKSPNFNKGPTNLEDRKAVNDACKLLAPGKPLMMGKCLDCPRGEQVIGENGAINCKYTQKDLEKADKFKEKKERSKKKKKSFWSGLWPWLLGLAAVAGAFFIGNRFFKAAVKKNEELNAPVTTTLPPTTPTPTTPTVRSRTAPGIGNN